MISMKCKRIDFNNLQVKCEKVLKKKRSFNVKSGNFALINIASAKKS
jgi:hypothetical protein